MAHMQAKFSHFWPQYIALGWEVVEPNKGVYPSIHQGKRQILLAKKEVK
jgi:hypothetical protein